MAENKWGLNDIMMAAHRNAAEKGFYEDVEAVCGYLQKHEQLGMRSAVKRDFVLGQLAKVGSEVGETVQVIQRKDIHADDVSEEMADIIIRVCDLAGYLDINLERAVIKKMTFNASRPYKHGKLC